MANAREGSSREGAPVTSAPITITISVVICAHAEERWSALTAAVASIQRQIHPAHEIVVVIDHHPGLFEQAHATLSNVVVVANMQDQGLSGARNTGVATASGEVVAFLDDDAQAAPDWLAQIAVGYTHADVVAVGGSIKPNWQLGRPTWFPEEFDWVVGCTYRGMPQVEAAVRNLIGCNMSIRRAILECIGGFQRGIGRFGADASGCEETELFIRMHQSFPNAIVLYRPEVSVSHMVPAERSTWHYFRARCRGEGRSKALMSRLVGRRDALADEQLYVRNILPAGLLRGITASLRTRNTAGLRRSGAILIGLAITSWTYLIQRSIRAVTCRAIHVRATTNDSIE